jgi:hypothetical protein
MGAAMVRLSNLALTPALSGLIMMTAFLLGAIVVRVFTVSEHIEVRTHTVRETGGQGTVKQDALKQPALDIGIADLRGTLR